MSTSRLVAQCVQTDLRCACHDHLIALDSWDDGDLFMQLWSPIHSKEYGRFHWAWESLKGRWSGNNEVVLDAEMTEKLRDALSAHLARHLPQKDPDNG